MHPQYPTRSDTDTKGGTLVSNSPFRVLAAARPGFRLCRTPPGRAGAYAFGESGRFATDARISPR